MSTAFPACLPLPAPEFCQSVICWYERHRRHLPWREDCDPYKVWVAETMLQQTTVQAVVPYFRTFLEAFPDVGALAGADESSVLARWAGLGYYHRARNLLKAARLICQKHQGKFPQDYRSALALPGVGRYTAGAVLSIAYGLPFPVQDGNVTRLFFRYFNFREEREPAERALWRLLAELVEQEPARSRVAEFNQGLMELGATVCTPRRPACPKCPLLASCAAFRSGTQASIPRQKAARPRIALHFSVALISRGQSLLMKRNLTEPFPKGLWEPPRISGQPAADVAGEFQAECGLVFDQFRMVGVLRHSITHHKLNIHVLVGDLRLGPLPDGFAWVDPEAAGISSYVKKALRLARPAQCSPRLCG